MSPVLPLPLDEHGVPIDPPPPQPEQVMAYARALQDEPDIWAIFQRMGAYGLPTDEEFARLEAFRDAWLHSAGMSHLNLNGFFGANMLLRRIIRGEIANLDAPEAMQFLQEDYPRNNVRRSRPSGGITTVPVRVEEVMWHALAVQRDHDLWANCREGLKEENRVEWWKRDDGRGAYIRFYWQVYTPKYGVVNRGFLDMFTLRVLQALVDGHFSELASEEAWVSVRDDFPTVYKQLP